jgi:hypothetical protein
MVFYSLYVSLHTTARIKSLFIIDATLFLVLTNFVANVIAKSARCTILKMRNLRPDYYSIFLMGFQHGPHYTTSFWSSLQFMLRMRLRTPPCVSSV